MSSAFANNATVTGRVEITDSLCILQIRNDSGPLEFKPGQFTMVGLSPDAPRCEGACAEEVKRKPTDTIIRRAYSMCTAPLTREYYEIYVSFVKAGELSPRLFRLKTGDRLWTSGKASGFFTTEYIPADKGLLMLSTGTGIAPFASMIRHAWAASSVKRSMILVNAIDVSPQLGYRMELEKYAKESGELFHYLPVVTFPDREPTWKGLTGWIQDDIRNGTYEKLASVTLSPDRWCGMLCGNPSMIKLAIAALEERGFKHGKAKEPGITILTEEYW